MLGRDALERDNKVLERSLLLVALRGLAMHEIVETSAAFEDVVNTRPKLKVSGASG